MLRVADGGWSAVSSACPLELDVLAVLPSLSFLLRDGGGRGGGEAAKDDAKNAWVLDEVGGEEGMGSACMVAPLSALKNSEDDVERVEEDEEEDESDDDERVKNMEILGVTRP